MKIFRNGWYCLGLIWMAAAVAAGAQQDARPDDPAAPPAEQAAAQQPQPPAQQPPQPPAQQPPQPPPQPEQAGSPRNPRLPPAPPKVIDVRMPGEAGFYIGLTGWLPVGPNYVDKGKEANFTASSYLKLAGTSHGSPGVEVGVAAGQHNTVKVSYFFSKTSGTVTAPNDVVIFGQTYFKGDRLTTNAKLSDAKVSFEYLTWPYPVERRHFRLKTLWQVQYITMRSVYDNPTKSATPDTNGALTDYSVLGSKSFFTPAFGIGLHEYATRNFHFQLDISGFAWPHRFQLVDSEATVGYRVGHLDIRGGVKAFHYRTSPKLDYFYRGTMAGAFVGIRWHSD